MGNHLSLDSAWTTHECSARNITWQYISHNGTLHFPYNTCPDAQLVLDTHCCYQGKCHPSHYFDPEWESYEENDWDGLGDPYQGAEHGAPSYCLKRLRHIHDWKRDDASGQLAEKNSHNTVVYDGSSTKHYAAQDHQQIGFSNPERSTTTTDGRHLIKANGRKTLIAMAPNNYTIDQPHKSFSLPQTTFKRPKAASIPDSKNFEAKQGEEPLKKKKKPQKQLDHLDAPSSHRPATQHIYNPDARLPAPDLPTDTTISAPQGMQKPVFSEPRFTGPQYDGHHHHMNTSVVIACALLILLGMTMLGYIFFLWSKSRKSGGMRGYRRVKREGAVPWVALAEEETVVDDLGVIRGSRV